MVKSEMEARIEKYKFQTIDEGIILDNRNKFFKLKKGK